MRGKSRMCLDHPQKVTPH